MATLKSSITTTRPLRFANYRKSLMIAVNGSDRGLRWDGITAAAEQLGITAPTTAATIAKSGTGTIIGTYTAYVRYLDDESLVSDLSPISNTLTVANGTGTITAASNAAPIVITSTAHGLSTGNTVRIEDVTGNTAANGDWVVTNLTADTFSLQTSVGNGTYNAGGTWTRGAAQIDYTGIPVSPEARVTKRQIFRNTAGQTDVYYLDGTLSDNTTTVLTSTNTDTQLALLTELPIFFPDGTASASRHGVPPTGAIDVAYFQSRMFYLVIDASNNPLLYFSEVDLPESVQSTSYVVYQQGDPDDDAPIGFMPSHGSLYILHKRHAYEITFTTQPDIDLYSRLVSNRGCLAGRAWTVAEGMVFAMDTQGVYRFGSDSEGFGREIQDYFRNSTILFTEASKFFGSYEPLQKVVRFHVSFTGDTYPKRALCYSLITGLWWQEAYTLGFGGAVSVSLAGKLRLLLGATSGVMVMNDTYLDVATAITWSWVSRLFDLSETDGFADREFRVWYSPTTAAESITLTYTLNHDTAAQTIRASTTNLGDPVTLTDGSANVSIDVKAVRSTAMSALNIREPGFAAFRFNGRLNDRSQADRWVKFKLTGTNMQEAFTIHGYELVGVDP